MLVLGAGVTGIEAARVAAARGHYVEVWEQAAMAGGQMPLAMAAPDKPEVEPVWTYRWQQVQALGVPVRMSVTVDMRALKTYAPDFVIVATGAVPRACPFDVTALDASIEVLHAWEILREPARVAQAQSFTIIGGGMVGIETADLLSQQGKRCTLIEALSSLAPGMTAEAETALAAKIDAEANEKLTEREIKRQSREAR